MNQTRHPADTVAIIGAGPAGLACARWLLQHGLEPLLFEAGGAPGGQWNQGAEHSAVWPGMRTNTCRLLTAFSDLEHPAGTPLFPRHDQVLAYLQRYAARFDVQHRIRTRTRVDGLERDGHAWRLTLRDAAGLQSQQLFRRVIVATGRQAAGALPALDGADRFDGELQVRHASAYRGPEAYRGRDVVVGGCSISALEIASELALSGARRVTLACRRARYVLPKLLAGVPTDVAMFTRGAALAGERLPLAEQRTGLRQALLQAGAQPSAYGAPAADEDPFLAGVSQAQHFLPLVAEGRIEVKPWIVGFQGREVQFTDGSRQLADGVLLGTGYRLHLPFLAPALTATLALDDAHIDLHEHTFHPDLPGLAFVGLYDQTGPLLPVLELQARWIAYVMAGLIAVPAQAMRQGVERYRAGRGGPQGVMMNAMALRFARLAGVEPDLARWPQLASALLQGPLSPVSFRLQGPDALVNAPAQVLADAQLFAGTAEGDRRAA
jgi:cation diffusion facilitator CzcD-associated flavoprotein CzcO